MPNDGPRVYATWLNVHGDVFSLAKWADYRSAAAAEAVARARADVAGRGLVATIVQNYYVLVASQRKLASAQQALREAQQFLDITQQQESGGEVAHADVVKAQIQVAQRTRDAQEAELAVLKSRLGLSVLIFPDFRDTFTVVDDLQTHGAAAAADRSEGGGDRRQPGRPRRDSGGRSRRLRGRRRPQRRPAVRVVRLLLRHRRQSVRHPRSGRSSACSARSRRCS